MLNSVSWDDFFTTMGLALLVYYAAIILVYYRKDIPPIISGLINTRRASIESETDSSKEYKETN